MESASDELGQVTRIVRQKAQALRRSGVRHLPGALRRAAAAPPSSVESSRLAGPRTLTIRADRAIVADEKRLTVLDEMAREVAECRKCDELARCRKQTVFGVGDPHAELCFVGEAPGADEDAQGEPFVGAAGQLLTKIITAMGLSRSKVYICNVLKCRPPGNRTPAPDEVSNCRGYLERQIEIIKPKYICALGAVAAKTLLDSTLSIGRLRGKFHQYNGIPVLCTYHPAYLLRNPDAKRDVWQDVQIIMRELGLEIPANATGQ